LNKVLRGSRNTIAMAVTPAPPDRPPMRQGPAGVGLLRNCCCWYQRPGKTRGQTGGGVGMGMYSSGSALPVGRVSDESLQISTAPGMTIPSGNAAGRARERSSIFMTTSSIEQHGWSVSTAPRGLPSMPRDVVLPIESSRGKITDWRTIRVAVATMQQPRAARRLSASRGLRSALD
jgi:hypothetical protein